jgi:predicted nuclease of predicted toxin-antitoxin system
MKTKSKIKNYKMLLFLHLLQNATSIEDFSRNIKHAYNIFCLKYESLQCLSSKNEIDNQLMKRNLTMLTIAEKDDDIKNIFKKFKANQIILILDNDFKESNLKMSSPFKIYFDKLINKHSQNIKMKLKNYNEKKENFFFCPQLFEILTDYTYILPFWTGIIIRYWKSINPNFESHVKDRIDNNYVENWFGQLNSVCSDMPVMPSVYTSRIYARIEAQFIDKYEYQNSDLKLNKTKDSLDEKEG